MDSSKLIALEQRAAITYGPFTASFRKHDADGSPQIVLSSQEICSLMTESSDSELLEVKSVVCPICVCWLANHI